MRLTSLSINLKSYVQSICAISLIIALLFLVWFQIAHYSQLQLQRRHQEINAIQHQIHTLESKILALDNDANQLSQHLKQSLTEEEIHNLPESLQKALKQNRNNGISSLEFLQFQQLPRAYQLLPYLLQNVMSLQPSLLVTKHRTNVTFALGIPTVKRPHTSYLQDTLKNLIANMNAKEKSQSVIIIFIGEMQKENIACIADDIKRGFSQDIESGLIEILAPHPSYYPDLTKLQLTLNDKLARVQWRSKQNLDYSYLMAYAQTKAKYYVQLEDDILSLPQFVTAMKNFTENVTSPWNVLDFCELGFIGKLFKADDLPPMITFFQMFFNDKPVDWLLDAFLDTYSCDLERNKKACRTNKEKIWLHYKPSLFQHIGKYSSLPGKMQKLKDTHFGVSSNDNPPAVVTSSISAYRNFKLDRAYKGEVYFWGMDPRAGDTVEFHFKNPIVIKRLRFRSGNNKHILDSFINTWVEVLPENTRQALRQLSRSKATCNNFIVVGSFNPAGVAEVVIEPGMGPIRKVRLHVHEDISHWVVLSEIIVEI